MTLGLLGGVSVRLGGCRQHEAQRVEVAVARHPANRAGQLIRPVADEISGAIGMTLHGVCPARSIGAAVHGKNDLRIDGTFRHTFGADRAVKDRIGTQRVKNRLDGFRVVRAHADAGAIDDQHGGTSTATVNVKVGAPDAVTPTATPLAPVAEADGSAIVPINVAPNFNDPNSDPLIFTASGLPPGLSMSPSGQITGALSNDASTHGPYTVYVTAIDPAGNQVTLPMVIGISNPAPTAVNDSATTPLDTPVTLNLVANDTDPDADALMVTNVGTPAHGTVVINLDGTVTYIPITGYTGPDTFTYTVSDGQGGTSIANVTLNVGTPSPTDPTAGIAAPQIGIDGGTVNINVPVLGSVVDPNGDPLTYSAIGLPPGLSINPITGVITGNLPTDASVKGPYLIQVYATDPTGGQIGVPFLLSATNPAPAPMNDKVTTPVDQPINISVLANDKDGGTDSDPLTVISTTAPAHGTVSINPDGTVKYTPTGGYVGPDTFTYSVSDGQGGTMTVTVDVTVGPAAGLAAQPAAPVTIVTDGQTITPVPVAAIFGDPEKTGALTIAVDPTKLPPGVTYNSLAKQFEGTPAAGASQGNTLNSPPGTYVVPVTATDSGGLTTTQFVTFTISNLPPVATEDASSVSEDGPVLAGNVITGAGNTVPGSGIDLDTPPDSDPLTVVAALQSGNPIVIGTPFTTAGGGVLTLNIDGSYIFNPGTAYNGLDVGQTATEIITYIVSDGNGGTSTTTLTITVNSANDSPVVIDPENSGTPANPIQAPDPLNIIPDVSATDGAPLPPINVGNYIVDPEGKPLTFAVDPASPAWVRIDPITGQMTGTPPAGASQLTNNGTPGQYLVTITATDSQGAPVVTTVMLMIGNLPPVAVNDQSTGDEDHSQTGNVLTDPVTGDHDTGPDSDPLTVAAVTGGTVGAPIALTYGNLTLNSDGSWSFVPNTTANTLPVGTTAHETVTYTISDGNGGTAHATLTIDVVGVNDAPTSTPLLPATGLEGSPLAIPVALVFHDVDTGDMLTFTATGLPAGLTIDPATGLISGTPAVGTGGNGSYTVVVTANDGHGETVTSVFALDVKVPTAAPPIIPPPSFSRPIRSDKPELQPVQLAIIDTVDGIGGLRNAVPTQDDNIISRTVDNLEDLNASMSFDQDGQNISRLVEWLKHQGKSSSWMNSLFDVLGETPYEGDAMALSLGDNGKSEFGIRSLEWGGALFVGIDSLVPGAKVISITQADGSPLPDYVFSLGHGDIVANILPGVVKLDLAMIGRLADGRLIKRYFSIDLAQATILRGHHLGKSLTMLDLQNQNVTRKIAFHRLAETHNHQSVG